MTIKASNGIGFNRIVSALTAQLSVSQQQELESGIENHALSFVFSLADEICIQFIPLHHVRTGGATVTARKFCGRASVDQVLKSKQAEGQPTREDGPQSHLITKGTPTMGGVLILLSLGIATLLYDLTNEYVWTALLVTLGSALLASSMTTKTNQTI